MFKVNNNLSIVDYSIAVRNIVSKFFDEDGNYTPHFGKINAMVVFYNYFVIESKFDLDHTITENIEADILANDEDFIMAFNNAIKGDGCIRLDFANAYSDALDIVHTKNTTIAGAIESFKNGIAKFADKINPIFTEDSINKLSKIAEDVSNGNLSAESIVSAYSNSKLLSSK